MHASSFIQNLILLAWKLLLMSFSILDCQCKQNSAVATLRIQSFGLTINLQRPKLKLDLNNL